MTPDERDACLALVHLPGGGRKLSPRRFLKRVGARDGVGWAASRITDAVERHDEDDLELALIPATVFGVDPASRQPLVRALNADWHHSHEGVLTALEKVASPDDLPDLLKAASWVPPYLEFDESRALARKAIHAVARIPGPEADEALTQLTGHEDDALARLAVRLLDQRSSPSTDGDHS